MSSVKRNTDNLLFTLRPSQWTNFGWFLAAIAGFWLVIPLIMLAWQLAVVFFWRFEFRERTIAWKKGVFSVTTVEVHYFRIKSIKVEEPFLMRLVGLSNIYLLTSDPYVPVLKLWAIRNSDEIRGMVMDYTFHWRQKQNTKELDLYDLSA